MKSLESKNIFELIEQLRAAGLQHRIRDDRCGAVSLDVTVPGERWEIDVLSDGTVEVEIFRSTGEIHDEIVLHDLFSRFAESATIKRNDL